MLYFQSLVTFPMFYVCCCFVQSCCCPYAHNNTQPIKMPYSNLCKAGNLHTTPSQSPFVLLCASKTHAHNPLLVSHHNNRHGCIKGCLVQHTTSLKHPLALLEPSSIIDGSTPNIVSNPFVSTNPNSDNILESSVKCYITVTMFLDDY